MFAKIKEFAKAHRISRCFDRDVLIKNVFPSILNQTDYLERGKAALWIGCRLYTRNYYTMIERNGANVRTIDIDPAADAYGRGGAHTRGCAASLSQYYPEDEFDVIFCNGVIGWGVDRHEDRQSCYAEMRRIMKPRSLLVLGWNTHKTPDPLANGDIAETFTSVEVPGFGRRLIVPATTHVFDMLSPIA